MAAKAYKAFMIAGAASVCAITLTLAAHKLYLTLLFTVIACLSFLPAAMFTGDGSAEKSKTALIFMLSAYFIGLFAVTVFGRNPGFIFALDPAERAERFREYMHFIPFETTLHYIKLIGTARTGETVLNVLGNFAVFTPLGFLLPVLFTKMRKRLRFIPLAFALSLSIELLQMVLVCGHFDVDDLILNTLGAWASYEFFRTRRMKELTERLFHTGV